MYKVDLRCNYQICNGQVGNLIKLQLKQERLPQKVFSKRKQIFLIWAQKQQLEPLQNQQQLKQIQQQLNQATLFSDQIDILSDRAFSLYEQNGENRVVIGLAGVPGGGKSTISGEVCSRINKGRDQELAIVLPMDGFHYTKAYLAQMEDPEMARFRRGAYWTFDAAAFVECVKKVVDFPYVLAPSFQHGVGDPVQDDIIIQDNHKIVIVEGNYVLLDIDPWNQLKEVFNESWYIECSLDEAMKTTRLIGVKCKTGDGFS
eukprot:TRINITY_DN18344_c0_g1_i2.p1 TRINITY_DN18344_c0_g1~~TRINITY_DN18344_c0_g1_i2.p1  ORF type:complete len:259 (-),score=20.33 TRINITY_DN18344_c0_g1_i2:21-797(-)